MNILESNIILILISEEEEILITHVELWKGAADGWQVTATRKEKCNFKVTILHASSAWGSTVTSFVVI